VIGLSREAETQVDRLIAHYEAKGRLGAAINLLNALERAKVRIALSGQARSTSALMLSGSRPTQPKRHTPHNSLRPNSATEAANRSGSHLTPPARYG
jgi:hypothetical protein